MKLIFLLLMACPLRGAGGPEVDPSDLAYVDPADFDRLSDVEKEVAEARLKAEFARTQATNADWEAKRAQARRDGVEAEMNAAEAELDAAAANQEPERRANAQRRLRDVQGKEREVEAYIAWREAERELADAQVDVADADVRLAEAELELGRYSLLRDPDVLDRYDQEAFFTRREEARAKRAEAMARVQDLERSADATKVRWERTQATEPAMRPGS